MAKKRTRNLQRLQKAPDSIGNDVAASEAGTGIEQATSDPTSEGRTWPGWARAIASLILVFHLFCVVIAPLSGPPPSSELSRQTAASVDGYIKAMFLGHGYRFFAPNPGPSHLVRYELLNENGEIKEGRFPDPKSHWPRLYYHRHFMLSETIHAMSPFVETEEVEAEFETRREELQDLKREYSLKIARQLEQELKEEERSFARQKAMEEALLSSLAEHLLKTHDATAIRIYSQEHILPSPFEIELGDTFEDPKFWLERLIYDSNPEAAWPLEEVE